MTCPDVPVLTLSPHTEGPYARQALVPALTASVAWPHPGGQNEWRLTAREDQSPTSRQFVW